MAGKDTKPLSDGEIAAAAKDDAPHADLLTLKQLSRKYGIPAGTLGRHARLGWIESIQPAGKGGKRYFEPDCLKRAPRNPKLMAPPDRIPGAPPKWLR